MDQKIDTAMLIEQIRLKPAIWDVSSKCYNDNQIRRRSWKELAVMFAGEGASPEKIITIGNLIHKKWKKIRDQYSREYQDRKGKSGDGPKKKIRYIYAQQLSFLNNTIMMNNATCSSDTIRTEKNGGVATLEKEVVTELNSSTPSTSQCKRKIGKKDKTLPTVKRKRSNPFDNKLIDALENLSQHRQKEITADDDDRHFLLSLTPTMKIIPTHLKLQVRMEIMQVINNVIFKNNDDEQVISHQNCSEQIYQTSPFACPTIQTFFASEHHSSTDSMHGHISCYSRDDAI